MVGFAPLVRAEARSQAKQRGLAVAIGKVRPGWGRVWLTDVDLSVPAMPALGAHLPAVEVELSPMLGVKRVAAHGGSVKLTGSPKDVAAQLRRWRSRHRRGRGGGALTHRAYSVDGLSVTWRQAAGDDPVEVWGARYDRDADGQEHVALDLGRLAWHGAHLRVRGGRVDLQRRDGHRVLERVLADGVAASIDLDRSGLRHALDRRVAVKAKAAAAPVKKTAKRTSKAKADAPFPSPSALRRGPELRSLFARFAAAAGALLPVGAKLDLGGLRLALRHDKQMLNIGPARLHVGRDEKQVSLDLVPGAAPGLQHHGTPLTLRLQVPLAAGPVLVALKGGPVSLAVLGVHEGDFGLSDVGRAELSAKLQLKLSADGRTLGLAGRGQLDRLSLERHWLSTRPVRGIHLSWQGQGEAALDGTRLHLDEGELEFGKVRIQAHGELERGQGYVRLRLDGGIPLASCQSMLDSSPAGLTPLLTGMRMSGTFSLDGHLDLDTRHPGKMVTQWKLDNQCRVTAVPAAVAPRRFQQSWVRQVKGPDGAPMSIESGPGSPGWVPGSVISPFMKTAVLVCEDGHFWSHHGFDQEAIKNAIREDFKAGRFVRGASTISMQLAKNLYLSRRKTLSRKLQEAVLTMLLEQQLTKDQIMELYLNVIEFGPGIYGVGPAAQHYFDTTADRLSLGQSLYLASILPNPKIQHFGSDGQVTKGWSAYLRKLMHIAHKIHRITDDQLADGLTEQVAFGVPYSPRSAEGDESGAVAPDGASAGNNAASSTVPATAAPAPGNVPAHDEATYP